MHPEQMINSARRTDESRGFYEELQTRFEDIYQRALSEPDHPSLECSPVPNAQVRDISGLIPLSEQQILRLRQELPAKSAELTSHIAQGLVPVAFVEIIHDRRAGKIEARSYLTYASTSPEGKIEAECLAPYFFAKEEVVLDPHATYPPAFISSDALRSMNHSLDIVDQSVRSLN